MRCSASWHRRAMVSGGPVTPNTSASGHRQRRARGQPRADRQGRLDVQGAARPGRASGDHAADQPGPGRLQAVGSPGRCPSRGSTARSSKADEVTTRVGSSVGAKVDGDAQTDGHGQGQTPVVVGVVPDQVDPAGTHARRAGGNGHAPLALRPGLVSRRITAGAVPPPVGCTGCAAGTGARVRRVRRSRDQVGSGGQATSGRRSHLTARRLLGHHPLMTISVLVRTGTAVGERPARRCPHHRAGRPRPRPLRRDDAGRRRRRHHPHRPVRPGHLPAQRTSPTSTS